MEKTTNNDISMHIEHSRCNAWLHGNTEYMPMNVNNAHSIHFQRFQIHNEIYRNGFLSLPISHILIEQRQPLNRNKQ